MKRGARKTELRLPSLRYHEELIWFITIVLIFFLDPTWVCIHKMQSDLNELIGSQCRPRLWYGSHSISLRVHIAAETRADEHLN